MAVQPLFFDIFARDNTKKVFDDLKAQAAGLGRNFRDFGQSYSMYVTAPIVAAGALTLKAAGDFEEGMNAVNAAAEGSTRRPSNRCGIWRSRSVPRRNIRRARRHPRSRC